nr:zinc finger, CCHC-type [Tanacetum cinerariifolium]
RAQGDREAEVFLVSIDDIAVAQRRLEDKKPEEKTSTDCLGNAAEGYRENSNKAAFAVGNAVTTATTITGSMPKQREMYLGLEIIRDKSGTTLRVSQSTIPNKKLIQTLLEGHFILSLKDSLSEDSDAEKNESGYELRLVAGIATGALVKGCSQSGSITSQGSLKANLQYMEALSTTKAIYMTFTEARKKEMWLKVFLTESGYELRLVAGIDTGALVKGCSRSEVPSHVKVVAYRYGPVVILMCKLLDTIFTLVNRSGALV